MIITLTKKNFPWKVVLTDKWGNKYTYYASQYQDEGSFLSFNSEAFTAKKYDKPM